MSVREPLRSAAARPLPRTWCARGSIWFGESQGQRIGRITTAGDITEFDIPANPYQMTIGADGNLWFTESIGGKIGRFTPGGEFTEFDTMTEKPFTIAIATGPDGNVWFSYFGDGQGYGKLASISPEGNITEYKIDLYASYMFFDSSGTLWFSATNNTICRRDSTGTITQFTPPTKFSDPADLVFGPDGNIWFTEAGAKQIARLALEK